MMAKRAVRLVGRDQELCSFLVRYKLATEKQIERELFRPGTTARRRLGKLKSAGLVKSDRIYYGMHNPYLVTARGARLADNDLPAPKLDLTKLRHTLELVDLSWALRNGISVDGGGLDLSLWPSLGFVTERELRRDKLRARRSKGSGRMGRGRTGHVPDGILLLNGGERIAVELELSDKRKDRYEDIFDGYRAQMASGEIDGVRWYFDSPAVMRTAAEAAARRGVRGFCEFRRYLLPQVLERLRRGDLPAH